MAAEPGDRKITFERALAAINTSILVFGLLFALVEFPTKFGSEKTAFAASLQTPTIPSSVLSVAPLQAFGDGSELYDVSYSVTTKNQSSRPVRITYAITELYLGDLHAPTLGPGGAYELNDPPNPWDGPFPGEIAWRRLMADAYEIDGGAPQAVDQFLATKAYGKTWRGGSMTGIVSPGDSTGVSPHFVVRARPGQYIGVVVGYGIDDAVRSPSALLNLTSDVKKLPGPKAAEE